MDIFEFGKHPATAVLEAADQLRQWWIKIFTRFTPSVFATYTYDREPPNADAAVGDAVAYGKQVSGVKRDTLQFMVTDRGPENDRLHLHGFLWTKDDLTPRDLRLFRKKWRHGISDISPFDDSLEGIDYVAKKIYRDGDFTTSTNLIRKLELWARMKLEPPTD